MARTFYTQQDIQDLVANGVRELHVTDNDTLTMLARETSQKLGLKLVFDSPDAEAPPHRAPLRLPHDEPLEAHVRGAVLTGAGAQAEAELVTTIVKRVLAEATHLDPQAEAEMVTTIVKRVLSKLNEQ